MAKNDLETGNNPQTSPYLEKRALALTLHLGSVARAGPIYVHRNGITLFDHNSGTNAPIGMWFLHGMNGAARCPSQAETGSADNLASVNRLELISPMWTILGPFLRLPSPASPPEVQKYGVLATENKERQRQVPLFANSGYLASYC